MPTLGSYGFQEGTNIVCKLATQVQTISQPHKMNVNRNINKTKWKSKELNVKAELKTEMQ